MGWDGGLISDEMALDMLYGDSISTERKEKELKFLQEQRKKAEQVPPASNPAAQGGFGQMGAENSYNDAHQKPTVDEVPEEAGVPELI